MLDYIDEDRFDDVEIDTENSIFELTRNGELIYQLTGFSRGRIGDLNEFFVFIMKSTPRPERDWINIECKKTNKGLGYLFPPAALGIESALNGEDDSVLLGYAVNALKGVLSRPKLRHSLMTTDGGGRSELPDFASVSRYDSNVVIINKSQLGLSELDIGEIITYLVTRGFYYPTEKHQVERSTDDSNPIKPRKFSPDLSDFSLEITNSINASNDANSPSAQFLLLYQVIEILIDIIFTDQIKNRFYHNLSAIDAWSLKKKLESLGSQKKRVHLLVSEYCDGSAPANRKLTDLKLSCTDFLRSVTGEDAEFEYETDALFMVRNMIVHKQYQGLGSEEQLDSLTYKLRAFIREVLCVFSLPNHNTE